MSKFFLKFQVLLFVSFAVAWQCEAQFTLTGQLRTRSEFRDGQGAPLPKGARPGFFTSQRTRLSLGYSMYRLRFGISAQDVRVWGQDVSTINRFTSQDNNGLMIHEAWAEILLTDTTSKNQSLSLKFGRQELVYDDSRLLGNLDWLQQARRHDAAVLKFEKKSILVHAGAAFNQNKETSSGTIYNSTPPANYPASTNSGAMYKSMQFLYASRKLKQGNISYLFFADEFSRFHNDTANSLPVKTFETGTWARFTTGIYFNQQFAKLNLTASAYQQFGKNAGGHKINGQLVSISAQYALHKKILAGAGVDFTSGGSKGAVSNTFDPLYGTPHKFWGLMDYFYAASGFGRNGLVDYYLKSRWKINDRLNLNADLHQFIIATKPATAGNNGKALGKEIDLVLTSTVTPNISIEGGYSHFFSRPLLTTTAIKNIANGRMNSNWAYIMISIRPAILVK